MRYLVLLLLVGLLGSSSAQTHPAAPVDPLQPVLWMAGDWEGSENGSDGSVKILLHAQVSENGRAVLYRVAFEKDGKLVSKYQGMYYWHPLKKQIVMTQVADQGNVSEGVYTPTSTSEADQHVNVVTDSSTFELKAHYKIGPNSFHFAGQFKPPNSTEWVPAVEADYRRVSSAGKK